MVDLNTILTGTRQYLLNEYDGLPAAFRETQNKAELIATCQKIVEGDLLENSDLDDLGFLKSYFKNAAEQNDKVTPFFSRLLLLKFLYEDTLKDPNLIQDKTWFREMRDKLKIEFEQLKQGQAPIKINGRVIHSLEELEGVRRQAVQQIQAPDRFYPVLVALAAAAILRKVFREFISERMNLALTAVFFLAIMNRHRLDDIAERGRTLFFAAQRAELHFRPENINIIDNDAIKKFFLLSDDELKLFNKGPELRQ